MLWHRQAIFKSKGDKLCSSAECRIWTWGPRHQIASRLNARWQTDWAIEDQAKNLNSTARPYDQRAFSPLDPTVSWLSHTYRCIGWFYTAYAASFVVVTSSSIHADIIKWKQIQRYWPFVRGIQRSPANSPHKGSVTRSFYIFFDLHLNKWLSKQSWGWLFKMPSRPLWCYCNTFNWCNWISCMLQGCFMVLAQK